MRRRDAAAAGAILENRGLGIPKSFGPRFNNNNNNGYPGPVCQAEAQLANGPHTRMRLAYSMRIPCSVQRTGDSYDPETHQHTQHRQATPRPRPPRQTNKGKPGRRRLRGDRKQRPPIPTAQPPASPARGPTSRTQQRKAARKSAPRPPAAPRAQPGTHTLPFRSGKQASTFSARR